MFNKVNKECEEIYVTQRRFSAQKNSGMNLIAVPEEKGDIAKENLSSYTMFILLTVSRTCGSTSHFASKLKILQQRSGMKSLPTGSNGNVPFGLGRITTHGFDVLMEMDERDPRLTAI